MAERGRRLCRNAFARIRVFHAARTSSLQSRAPMTQRWLASAPRHACSVSSNVLSLRFTENFLEPAAGRRVLRAALALSGQSRCFRSLAGSWLSFSPSLQSCAPTPLLLPSHSSLLPALALFQATPSQPSLREPQPLLLFRHRRLYLPLGGPPSGQSAQRLAAGAAPHFLTFRRRDSGCLLEIASLVHLLLV